MIKGLRVKNPLYLNANILLNELIKTKYNKKSHKRSSLEALFDKKYTLFVSSLTKVETISNLIKRKSVKEKDARELYKIIKNKYNILELNNINASVNLSDHTLEYLIKTNLDFKDLIHVLFCKKNNLPIATHDKKMLKNHNDKVKLYKHVYKPEELLL